MASNDKVEQELTRRRDALRGRARAIVKMRRPAFVREAVELALIMRPQRE
jgi:hypothetical protein